MENSSHFARNWRPALTSVWCFFGVRSGVLGKFSGDLQAKYAGRLRRLRSLCVGLFLLGEYFSCCG